MKTAKTDAFWSSELHMALLAWKNGDITMAELKKIIHLRDCQLCEAIEREVIGEDEATEYQITDFVGSSKNPMRNTPVVRKGVGTLEDKYRNELRTEQRAKLRAFCGIAETEKEGSAVEGNQHG